MKIQIVLITLLISYAICNQKLHSMISDHEYKVFKINSMKDYQKYVSTEKLDSIRIFLVVVGDSLKDKCKYCDTFKQQFFFSAKEYFKLYHPKLLWLYLEYEEKEDLHQIVQGLELNSGFIPNSFSKLTVPSIFIFRDGERRGIKCDLQTKHFLSCIQEITNFEPPPAIKSYLEGAEQQQQRPYRGNLSFSLTFYFFWLVFGLCIGLPLVIGLYFGYKDWKKFLVCLLCFCIFIITAGGLVYTLITESGKSYGKNLFYPQQRIQMQYEGYVAMFIVILFSLSWIAITDIFPYYKFNFKKNFISGKQIVGGTLLILMCVFFLIAFNCYLIKYNWYLGGTPFWGNFVAFVSGLPINSLFDWFNLQN